MSYASKAPRSRRPLVAGAFVLIVGTALLSHPTHASFFSRQPSPSSQLAAGSADVASDMTINNLTLTGALTVASPDNRLHVSSNGILLNNNSGYLFTDTGGTPRIGALLDNKNTYLLGIGATNIPFGGDMWLRTPGNNPAVIIKAGSGNVGIGTQAPTQKLDVAGAVNASSLCIAGVCRTSWPSSGSGESSAIPTLQDVTNAGAVSNKIISIGGLCLSGVCQTSWPSALLTGTNAIRYADRFPGADAGEKIQNAINDLPSYGGIVDARGFSTGHFCKAL